MRPELVVIIIAVALSAIVARASDAGSGSPPSSRPSTVRSSLKPQPPAKAKIVDITGIDKALLLQRLWESQVPSVEELQGKNGLGDRLEDFNPGVTNITRFIERHPKLTGRIIWADLSKDAVDPTLYDHNAGPNVFSYVVKAIRDNRDDVISEYEMGRRLKRRLRRSRHIDLIMNQITCLIKVSEGLAADAATCVYAMVSRESGVMSSHIETATKNARLASDVGRAYIDSTLACVEEHSQECMDSTDQFLKAITVALHLSERGSETNTEHP